MNDFPAHALSASLTLMAFMLAITGLLVPEYRQTGLEELKFAYWVLVWGTTICSMLAAVAAGLSLWALCGGHAYAGAIALLLGFITAATFIGVPGFTHYTIEFTYN